MEKVIELEGIKANINHSLLWNFNVKTDCDKNQQKKAKVDN